MTGRFIKHTIMQGTYPNSQDTTEQALSSACGNVKILKGFTDIVAHSRGKRWRAGVGFPGVLFVLKGTTPCRRNPCVVGSSSSQNHWNSTRRLCVFRLRHGR
ncbi:hypothetical protein HPB52_019323 [Rhipicephalus sanguineus]|uniref:Uncharacterized protein n=1 Tax=Rhipicephalus sanguineus TaxID=34632 RepID=A0A9D4Q823_RHISA|nr:hypothetical protein HPB52_019323 [Rhipicephalus sanguineus]